MRTKTVAVASLLASLVLILVCVRLHAQSSNQPAAKSKSSPAKSKTTKLTDPNPGAPKASDAKPSDSPKPNLLGNWQLVKDKSDFGGVAAPAKMERVVSGPDPTLRVITRQFEGEKKTEASMKYFTNGFETKNFIKGQLAYSVASWQGPVLSIKTNMQDPQGGYLILLDEWQLSDDKKTLNTTTKIRTAKGEVNLKLAWTRVDDLGG